MIHLNAIFVLVVLEVLVNFLKFIRLLTNVSSVIEGICFKEISVMS